MPFRGILLICLLYPVWASAKCPEQCKELGGALKRAKASIERLKLIKQANLEYMKELAEYQSGQKLKANSNIFISDKRILKFEQEVEELGQRSHRLKCRSMCEEKEL